MANCALLTGNTRQDSAYLSQFLLSKGYNSVLTKSPPSDSV